MRPRFAFLFIVVGVVLGACSSGEPAATSTSIPTDVPTSLPELTATPTIPLAILILPADMDAESSNHYQKTVYDLAQASGLRYQLRNGLSPDELESGLQVVIALPPDPGITALAAAAPDVQFLAINLPGITAGGNISILGSNSQSDVSAFLAGYTAALVTQDYRIGMMMPKDNSDAIRMFNAFTNGMKYYCGSCNPYFFLPYSFPQYLEIPAEEDKNNYDAFADILILQRKVETLFIHQDIYTQDLVDYIGTTGTSMIGTISPEQRPAGWIMTIQPDTLKAIQTAWPNLVAGQGGITVQSPLGLYDIDPSLLSPGRQRLVQKTLDDLQAGHILP